MAYNPTNPNGQATSANSQPVVIASDQSTINTSDVSVVNQGTATAALKGYLELGAVTISAPSYTNGQANPLSLTTAGALRVDGSGVTQPVSGTVTISQSTAANLNATVVGTGTFAVQADTELPAAAALADGAANPTTPTVGAAGLVYNGATWDRVEGANVFDGNAATNYTGVLAVKNVGKRVNPTALAAALNSASTVDVSGASTVTVAINTTTTGSFIIEGTADNTNWGNLECYDIFADAWVSGTSITPTAGKVYSILAGGMRQVRIRVNSALGGTVAHFWTLDNTQEFIAGIDTGAAPHNFGYTVFHKEGNYAAVQTSVALHSTTAGKKFAITDITVSTEGTTAGVVTIYDASGTTAFTAGTTPSVFRSAFAPSTTAKPGAVKHFPVPYVSAAAGNNVLVTITGITTSYIQINGYEI